MLAVFDILCTLEGSDRAVPKRAKHRDRGARDEAGQMNGGHAKEAGSERQEGRREWRVGIHAHNKART